MWHVTFYKHLVYVVFVSFIRQSRHCYLKDSWEFLHSLDLGKNNPWIGYTFQRVIRFSLRKRFTTILRGDSKHIQNRFCFSKTKDFMFQRLISKHMQTPASKCSIPRIPVCVYVCVSVCVCLCMMGKGGGAGKGIHLLMFHEVVWDIKKSSSAAGRTSCRLGNTSTCPYVRFDIQRSHQQLQEWSKSSSKSSSAAVFHHVLVLPSCRHSCLHSIAKNIDLKNQLIYNLLQVL